MKKKISVLLILTMMLASLFSVSALAVDEHINDKGEHADNMRILFMTEEEFQQLLSGHVGFMSPRLNYCCPNMTLTWRITKEIHVFDSENSGVCKFVYIYGDKYCTSCKTVWELNVKISSLSGCGKTHK